MNKIQLLLFASILLFACKSDDSSTTTEKTNTAKSVKCYMSVNKNDVKFEWTAFKTSEKIGVKGTFNEIEINNNKSELEIIELLKGTEFQINLTTVNSSNEGRDAKLVKFFFEKLTNIDHFTGYIKDANGSNFEGEAFIALTMNSIENIVKMNYTMEDNLIILKGDLDLLDWKANESLDALHKACEDKHKGKDGIAKTWSEMHIEVIVPLIIDCK